MDAVIVCALPPATFVSGGIEVVTPPALAGGVVMRGSMVLQCRQKPGSFEMQGETMRFALDRPDHLAAHCPNVNFAELEWKTKADRAVIPYGLLVRVWPKGKDPAAAAYSSPVDGGKWWAKEQ